MLNDFKKFILKGNVLDLAVGVIIGAAFGKVVTSFVADIMMPPLGLLVGRVDFSNLFVNLSNTPYASLADAKKAGAPTINYGLFLNNVLDLMIVGFAVFLLIRAISKLQRRHEAAATTRPCPACTLAIPLAAKRCPQCTSEVVPA